MHQFAGFLFLSAVGTWIMGYVADPVAATFSGPKLMGRQPKHRLWLVCVSFCCSKRFVFWGGSVLMRLGRLFHSFGSWLESESV